MINSSCIRNLVLAGCLALASQAASAIEVFSTSDLPFRHLPDSKKPCYLDVASSQLNEINDSIQSAGRVDASELRLRFSREFQAISDSTLCRNRAAALGLTKLPAIVFDDKDVIYGVSDMRVAEDMYQHHREPSTW